MIIVLKNADFSANNIGKVNVDNINPFTLAAIEASGNDTMTENQISALNSFFSTIGAWSEEENTIFSRMNVIYLPILAKDVAHSMINYVDNTIPKTSGNVEVTPTGAILRNNGLVATDFTIDPKSAKITRATWVGEFSVFWLRTEKFTEQSSANQNYAIWVREQPANKVLMGLYETKVSANHALSVSGTTGMSYSSAPNDTEVLGGQCVVARGTNDGYIVFNGLGKVENAFTLDADYTPGENSWFETRGFGFSKINDSAAIGVVMFGKGLTNAEADSVITAINGLRDAFLA